MKGDFKKLEEKIAIESVEKAIENCNNPYIIDAIDYFDDKFDNGKFKRDKPLTLDEMLDFVEGL